MPPRKDRVGVTRIEQRRIAAGLTQRELARQADISLSTLQRIEQLENDNPGVRYLANIASVLECEIEELIEGSWREPMKNRWGRAR
jgi:transcriptional regulator with XRE-family HTH domain